MIKSKRYKFYLAFSDLLILIISALSSFYFIDRNETFNIFSAGVAKDFAVIPYIMIGAVYLFIFESTQLYKPSTILKRSTHLNAVLKAVLCLSTGFILFTFLLEYTSLLKAGVFIGTFTVVTFILLYLYRVEIITPIYLSKGELSKNILIVGDGEKGDQIASAFSSIRSNGLNVIGVVNADFSNQYENTKKYIGHISEISTVIKTNDINELIIASDTNDYEELFKIIDRCKRENISLKVCSSLFDVVSKKTKCEKYGDIPVVNLSRENSIYTEYGIKRTVDIVGAFIGLVLLSPLFLIIAALIKVTSPGPVFFKQNRIGKNGTQFKFYKFRSMYQTAGEDEDEKRAKVMKEFVKKKKHELEDAKVVNLSRVTKIGQILRKTSLDELPQLYNVLKGDMSLVGARPDVSYVYEIYENWQKKRVKSLPGCTGVWQVTGRSDVTFNEMILLDIYYLHNVSFLLDLKMILLTIPVMLLARGGK